MATYKELKEQAAALDARIELAHRSERRIILDEVRAKVRDYGLTVQEVFHRRGTARNAPVRPKYRDPVTGTTWTGRGREPVWIRGRNRDEFLIDWV